MQVRAHYCYSLSTPRGKLSSTLRAPQRRRRRRAPFLRQPLLAFALHERFAPPALPHCHLSFALRRLWLLQGRRGSPLHFPILHRVSFDLSRALLILTCTSLPPLVPSSRPQTASPYPPKSSENISPRSSHVPVDRHSHFATRPPYHFGPALVRPRDNPSPILSEPLPVCVTPSTAFLFPSDALPSNLRSHLQPPQFIANSSSITQARRMHRFDCTRAVAFKRHKCCLV